MLIYRVSMDVLCHGYVILKFFLLLQRIFSTVLLNACPLQLVSAEGSNVSDGGASQCTDSVARIADHG